MFDVQNMTWTYFAGVATYDEMDVCITTKHWDLIRRSDNRAMTGAFVVK